VKARLASHMLNELAKPPAQLGFQFFPNVATGHQYHDATRDRKALPVTTAKRATALLVACGNHPLAWLAELCYQDELVMPLKRDKDPTPAA
jgi:hypothetical protein